MDVGQHLELLEDLGSQQVGRGEIAARVVDRGDVEIVEDGVGILVGHLILGERAVQHGRQALVEALGGLQQTVVLRRAEVVVAADLGLLAVARGLQPGRVLAVGTG